MNSASHQLSDGRPQTHVLPMKSCVAAGPVELMKRGKGSDCNRVSSEPLV